MGFFDSLFGGGDTGSTTVKQQYPAGWESAYKSLITQARQEANKRYPTYGQDRIAPFSQDTLSAFARTRGLIGEYDPILRSATQRVAGYGDFDAARAAQYMSPYQQGVTDIAKREAIRDYDLAEQGRNTQAITRGAFGGTRDALLRARANEDLMKNLTDIQTRGLQSGFENAQQQYERDRAYGSTAAATLSNLAKSQFDISKPLLTQGATQEGKTQSGLDLAYQDFLNQRDWRWGQLGQLSNILQGVPSGGTVQTGEAGTPNYLGQLAGAGLGIYGLGSGMGWWKKGGRVKRYAEGGKVRREHKVIKGMISDEGTPAWLRAVQAEEERLAREGVSPGRDGIDITITPDRGRPDFIPTGEPQITTPYSRGEPGAQDTEFGHPWLGAFGRGLSELNRVFSPAHVLMGQDVSPETPPQTLSGPPAEAPAPAPAPARGGGGGLSMFNVPPPGSRPTEPVKAPPEEDKWSKNMPLLAMAARMMQSKPGEGLFGAIGAGAQTAISTFQEQKMREQDLAQKERALQLEERKVAADEVLAAAQAEAYRARAAGGGGSGGGGGANISRMIALAKALIDSGDPDSVEKGNAMLSQLYAIMGGGSAETPDMEFDAEGNLIE